MFTEEEKKILKKYVTSTEDGVFAVKGETIAAKPADALPETVKQALIQNRKMATYRSVEALRKAATVKDYRFSFY